LKRIETAAWSLSCPEITFSNIPGERQGKTGTPSMLDRWMAAVGPLILLSVLPAIIVLMLSLSLGVYWGPRLFWLVNGNATRNDGLA
jgi:hypothetical protein